MDLNLSSANERAVQEVLENCAEELIEFITDSNTHFHAAKAVISFVLSEHYNSKCEGDT